MNLRSSVRSIPDFPQKGIMFRDITTLLADPDAFSYTIDQFYQKYKNQGISKVIGIESRGFIVGSALASKLHCGFIPIRKPGKLPAPTYQQEYQLEYGTDIIEIHKDALQQNEKVLIHDDLLATGGTIEAACHLVKKLDAQIIGLSFIIELKFLHARERLKEYDIYSLIQYESEEA